jgi:hypothetical protein
LGGNLSAVDDDVASHGDAVISLRGDRAAVEAGALDYLNTIAVTLRKE